MINDFLVESQIEQDIRNINAILNTNIFDKDHATHPLRQAAFIQLLICLRDLMYKTQKYSRRISFADDVIITDKVHDVTDLIKYVRDAVCHPDIPNHKIDQTIITFCVIYGKGSSITIGNTELKSDYDDDICFIFGAQKIYLRRHIIRAFNEAFAKLTPLLHNPMF